MGSFSILVFFMGTKKGLQTNKKAILVCDIPCALYRTSQHLKMSKCRKDLRTLWISDGVGAFRATRRD
jgi:hypothetical protein